MRDLVGFAFASVVILSGCAITPSTADWHKAAGRLATVGFKLSAEASACAQAGSTLPSKSQCLHVCMRQYNRCLDLAGDDALKQYACYLQFEACTLPCDPI